MEAAEPLAESAGHVGMSQDCAASPRAPSGNEQSSKRTYKFYRKAKYEVRLRTPQSSESTQLEVLAKVTGIEKSHKI